MQYPSNTLRRMSEVLDALKISSVYHEDSETFELKDQKLIILEDKSCYKADYLRQGQKVILIYPDGTLTFLSSDKTEKPVFIMHCKNCEKYYFTERVHRMPMLCPVNEAHSVSFFAKEKIPGWFGEESDSIIEADNFNDHLLALDNADTSKLESVYNKLKGHPKYICIDEDKLQKIKDLEKKYPNMKDVIDYILQNAKASRLKKNGALSFKPFVLLGGPGCGKSSFARDLCMILMGKPPVKIDLGNDVANFTLSGSDPAYKSSSHGLIVESMFADSDGRPTKNPIILFDELDKIKGDQNHSIETIFYSILEKSNSRRFFNNYLGINVDASGINYIFTANKLDGIPLPILNRLKIFEIKDYTHEQLRDFVLDNFYENWLESSGMLREFLPAVLSEEIRNRILLYSNDDPRSIEDSIVKVCNETLTTDPETNEQIALFSPRELYLGWKKFRGSPAISKDPWKIPEKELPLLF